MKTAVTLITATAMVWSGLCFTLAALCLLAASPVFFVALTGAVVGASVATAAMCKLADMDLQEEE